MKRFLMLLCVMAVFVNFAGCFGSDDDSDDKGYNVSFTLVADKDYPVSFTDQWIFDVSGSNLDGYWDGDGEDYLEMEFPSNCTAGDSFNYQDDRIDFEVNYQGRLGKIVNLPSDKNFTITITEKTDSVVAGNFSGDIEGTVGVGTAYFTIRDGKFRGDVSKE